jgi:hypothetical protein
MSNLDQIQKNVQAVNDQISAIGAEIQSAVDSGNSAKLKEVANQVKMMKSQLLGLKKEQAKKMIEAKMPDQKVGAEEDYSLTKMWGDQRYNPYWLKVAEYFGVKEKEFSLAQNKISDILDWAANTAKSRKMSDIIATIGKTARKLSSPGYTERPYAILYRYIKLEAEKQMANPQAKKDIEKEMSAYKK